MGAGGAISEFNYDELVELGYKIDEYYAKEMAKF